MDKNRVIFFSPDDLARFDMLEKSQKILDNYNELQMSYDILDVIELYHVKLYIESDLRLDSWSEDLFNSYKNKIKLIWPKVFRYFTLINDGNIEKLLNDINEREIRYVTSFWGLIEKCDVYKRLSNDVFAILFTNTNWKEDILIWKKIVNYFNTQLRGLLQNYKGTAELLLYHYAKIGSNKLERINIPSSLTIKDREEIIDRYIESSEANPNYVQLVVTMRNQPGLQLSPSIRLKAKKQYEKFTNDLLLSDKCATAHLHYGVSFSESQIEAVSISKEDNEFMYIYGIPYIQRDLSCFAILKNFQKLFSFFDNQSRISLVRKRKDVGFMDIIGLHQDDEYLCPQMFQIKNSLAYVQLVAYEYILSQYFNISLESAIKDMFNSICNLQKIENLNIQFDTSSDYLVKIRYLYPEIDSILKKYKLYVEQGSIDLELLEINSSPIGIDDIPSLIPRKYAYQCSEQINRIAFYLFSDQSALFFIDECLGKGYKSLVELISNENITFESLDEYQKASYQELISLGYLEIQNNVICIKDTETIYILKELYDNDAISYCHIPIEYRTIIDKLYEKGLIKFESKLFSRAEIDYLNFLLNKSFCNGLDLRNKYAHGSHRTDEQAIKNDYYSLLLIAILIIWKIIDDIICKEEYKSWS